MGRFTTTLTSAAAAGLTALAVTVAAPAIGDDGENGKTDTAGGKVEHRDGPTPQGLKACLERHGATGVPAWDADEGRALKQWIVAHQSDASAKTALQACDVYFDGKKPGSGTRDDKGAVVCAESKRPTGQARAFGGTPNASRPRG